MSSENDNDAMAQLTNLLSQALNQNNQNSNGQDNGFRRPQHPMNQGNEYPQMDTPPLVGGGASYFTPHNMVTMMSSIIVTTVFVMLAYTTLENAQSNFKADLERQEETNTEQIERITIDSKRYTDNKVTLYKATVDLKFQSFELSAQTITGKMETLLDEIKGVRQAIGDSDSEQDRKWDSIDDRMGELERSVESIWREARKKPPTN